MTAHLHSTVFQAGYLRRTKPTLHSRSARTLAYLFPIALAVLGGQGETYSLFQDKVDEAEARLEVATDANDTCKRR